MCKIQPEHEVVYSFLLSGHFGVVIKDLVADRTKAGVMCIQDQYFVLLSLNVIPLSSYRF